MTWLLLIGGGSVLWVLAGALGIVIGRRAPERKVAFSYGMTTAFVAADLFYFCAAVFLNFLGTFPLGGVLPLALLFGFPPGFVAGIVATFTWKGPPVRPSPLHPDLEREARARFNPQGQTASNDAIRETRQETMERSDQG